MPLYFFHTQTDTRYTDREGTMFEHPAQARREAIQVCGEMMREAPETFWGTRPWTVTVTDGAGLVLWEISMDGAATAAAPE